MPSRIRGRDGVAALNLFVMRHDRHIRDELPVCTDLCLAPTVDEQSSSDLRGKAICSNLELQTEPA
jgi:hypothetical protein